MSSLDPQAPATLGDVARLCGAELRGAGEDLKVVGVSPLDEATPAHVSFYANPMYRPQLNSCRAAAILVRPSDAELPMLAGRGLLVIDQPYAAFAKIATAFNPPRRYAPGVDPSARVEQGAVVDPSARVEAFAFVGAGAVIGPRSVIRTGAYVGAEAKIGADTVLHPQAVVYERCVVGDHCILHSGSVIGADGFGFAFDPEGDGEGPIHRKIPQSGIARIEDHVEIGANSCVDRATFGETVVGRGTKIDNLVQIAHNVTLGPMCLMAAQVGIAGSTQVGAGVAMGGQVGVSGHLHIADMAQFGAKAGIAQDIPAPGSYAGWPAVEQKQWLRSVSAISRLADLLRDVRELRRKLGIPREDSARK